jgi:general secretion pathway protein K
MTGRDSGSVGGMDRQRGFALVTVLWGVLILAVIAAAMLSSVRVSSNLAAAGLARAEAEALADAAVNRAVLGLLDPRVDHRWRVDGVTRGAVFKEWPVSVAIQDEYGKIDLNAAGRDMLRRMFVVAGRTPDEADGLADAVLDWREKGDAPRLHGAKADDYRKAGYDYVPRGGPFQTVGELKLVMGMTAALFRQIEPIVTVYSQRARLNTETAPLAALLSVPGMDAAQADTLIHTRNAGQPGSAGAGPITAGVIDPSLQLAGWPFTIRVEVPMKTGRLVRAVTIRLTGDLNRPFWVLATRAIDAQN